MRRRGDWRIRFRTSRVGMLKGFGRCIGSSFYPPGPLLALELQNWNGRGTTGRNRSSLDPDYFPKDALQRSPVSSLFAENAGLCPLPLAPFGAIASFSSERNAVNKSSALTMNRFPIAVCIDAKKQSVLGEMLGDAEDQPMT